MFVTFVWCPYFALCFLWFAITITDWCSDTSLVNAARKMGAIWYHRSCQHWVWLWLVTITWTNADLLLKNKTNYNEIFIQIVTSFTKMFVEILSAKQQSFYVSFSVIRLKLSYGTCLTFVWMHYSPAAQFMSGWYPPCSDVCMGSQALIPGGRFAGRISFDTWTRDNTSTGAKHTYTIIHWQIYGMIILRPIAIKKQSHILLPFMRSSPNPAVWKDRQKK